MDDIVKAALRKWPNVPHCYGWLALDARGDWYMRDEGAQAAGPFPRIKGSRIQHSKLLDFIHRNYLADARGCWYFQNGPQRVYVQLEAAPLVWRLMWADGGLTVTAHHGLPGVVQGCWLDDSGRLFLDSVLGFGLVHTQDMHAAADAVERGIWLPQSLSFAAMPARFGFVLQPWAELV